MQFHLKAARFGNQRAKIAACALASALLAAVPSSVLAQSPTPEPSASPSPSASPTPAPLEQAVDLIRTARDIKDNRYQSVCQLGDFRDGDPEMADLARRLISSRDNLTAVLGALDDCDIQFGATSEDARAETHPDETPPKIIVSHTLAAADPEIIADLLAHEGLHVVIKKESNSIDEEFLCFKKEAEVWSTIKRPGQADDECDTVLSLLAQGEDVLRQAIKQAYPELPDKAKK